MRALIVDDDIATVEVIRDCVRWQSLGIDEVYIAYNISNAKQIISDNNIDIIVSDIEMPQGTGLDLLTWVREQGLECEFLLLTCHENFNYASYAISMNAAAYLTKPFDEERMELSLRKVILKINDKRELIKSSEYGEWLSKNARLSRLDFWTSLMNGSISGDKKRLMAAIEHRRLKLSLEDKFRLVISKVTGFEEDKEKFKEGLFEFVLEGFHSELLNQQIDNENVIKYQDDHSLYIISICQEAKYTTLEERCRVLSRTCGKYLKSTLTYCIGNLYFTEELFPAKERIIKLLQQNVAYYGQIFSENDAIDNTSDQNQIMDMEKIVLSLKEKDKNLLLNYLKLLFEEFTAYRKLNEHVLYLMKQEILQGVYSHLLQRGIHATRLFHDDTSIALASRASQSTVDMIRWVNYLMERTFQYEEEVHKSYTIIENINLYIKEHFKEEIGRNEIAAVFYLAPEYLAKLYKRKTGKYLNDYISEYRIEQAKLLLQKNDLRISDVAEEVGFDNFSYFSTMFKKYVGMTPNEYRKKD